MTNPNANDVSKTGIVPTAAAAARTPPHRTTSTSATTGAPPSSLMSLSMLSRHVGASSAASSPIIHHNLAMSLLGSARRGASSFPLSTAMSTAMPSTMRVPTTVSRQTLLSIIDEAVAITSLDQDGDNGEGRTGAASPDASVHRRRRRAQPPHPQSFKRQRPNGDAQ
eukprot:CAMPEP_0119562316 /NCGR_PEP_ID=MMETSP1352-20130426/20052_1 /TAXON_ID=265584 /ORGANISM="Stauroneis constricta, Strain CCMP1120" /LENGTH=166 /DNA_ID=CAMNT_0007610687 /DNA_START=58 /DNA_END=558 /DNA_ORIENTATION=-